MKKIFLKDINFSSAKRFLIAYVGKKSTVGWGSISSIKVHFLVYNLTRGCHENKTPLCHSFRQSLKRANLCNFYYLSTLFFCFWLLVTMPNCRWHQATKKIGMKLPCCCPCSLLPNKENSWCWSDDFSVLCFFSWKEKR